MTYFSMNGLSAVGFLAATAVSGCAADAGYDRAEPGARLDYVVSSDQEAGLLARIDYPTVDATVEFYGDDDGDISTAVSYLSGGINPASGVPFETMLPVETFAALTGEAPPPALLRAQERSLRMGAKLLTSERSASATDGDELDGDLGVAASALSSSEFRDLGCKDAEVCKTRLEGNHAFKSGQNRTSAWIHADAIQGDIRVRLRKYVGRVIGWQNVGSSVLVRQGHAVVFVRSIGNVIKRTLQVKVEEAEQNGVKDVYRLAIDWEDAHITLLGPCTNGDFECE